MEEIAQKTMLKFLLSWRPHSFQLTSATLRSIVPESESERKSKRQRGTTMNKRPENGRILARIDRKLKVLLVAKDGQTDR